MAGRFAPPPTVRAYARWRLAVLRTMHRRRSARFAPSPYAGADAPRHIRKPPPADSVFRTPQTATAPRRSSNVASPFREPICAVVRLRTDHCLLPTPWTLTASATFLPGNTPLSRNVRRLRSVILMPPAISTPHAFEPPSLPWPVARPAACVNGPAHPPGSASATQVSPTPRLWHRSRYPLR